MKKSSMKGRSKMKEKTNEVKPNHNFDKRWKRPAVAAAITLLWMLPAAHSESEYKEREEGSPAGQTRHVSYPFGYRHLSSQWGDARNQIVPGIVDFDIRPQSWPVSIVTRMAFGYSAALPIGADPRASFSGSWDIDLGVRHVWSGPCTDVVFPRHRKIGLTYSRTWILLCVSAGAPLRPH